MTDKWLFSLFYFLLIFSFPFLCQLETAQIILLRLWVGESVMTSLHWAELRLRVPLSRWSAISSAMKVFKSTSWRPFLRRPGVEPALRCVGDPGAPERMLILAMAPLRPEHTHTRYQLFQSRTVSQHTQKCVKFSKNIPCRAMASLNGCRSVSTDELVSEDGAMAILGGARELRGGGALPHRKLMRSSRRMVRLLFFTQARTSLLRR